MLCRKRAVSTHTHISCLSIGYIEHAEGDTGLVFMEGNRNFVSLQCSPLVWVCGPIESLGFTVVPSPDPLPETVTLWLGVFWSSKM